MNKSMLFGELDAPAVNSPNQKRLKRRRGLTLSQGSLILIASITLKLTFRLVVVTRAELHEWD